MKYIFSFLLLGSLIACNNSDQQGNTSVKGSDNSADSNRFKALQDSSNFTTLEWIDSAQQKLNPVTEGQVVEVSWRFRNTGNKPLVIASVQPGCGCTQAGELPEPVAPGKEGVIKVKFDSNGRPGTQHKYVSVLANNSNKNADGQNQLAFDLDVTPKK